jgi:hypothetical protein
MATRSLQLIRASSSRGARPLQQRLDLLIAQVGVACAAATTLIEGIDTEREKQAAACMPMVLDDLREKLEQLSGDIERLEREPQT